jgi:uncharacterized protein YutE (UPF0331/DUF86 family)
MTPGELRPEIVAERAAWVREMLSGLRALPLDTYEDFAADPRNPAAAESFLRRALEALLDLGRHVLAKGFGRAAAEYKEIATALGEVGVLDEGTCGILREMAGFRNRLVHFYHQVSDSELYETCTRDAGDIERILDALLTWTRTSLEGPEGAPGDVRR